jgi:hypothetical protein
MHKVIIAFYIPFKCAFEDEPSWSTVYFDFYLDLVFFIEILITFNMPLYDQKSRLVTDRKVIAIKYLRTFFILDLVFLFPFSYYRKISATTPRDKDDLLNFVSLNFTSVPRFYKILLFGKILRIRKVTELISYCLKKTSITVQT